MSKKKSENIRPEIEDSERAQNIPFQVSKSLSRFKYATYSTKFFFSFVGTRRCSRGLPDEDLQ
jgi:hypothetical protein